MVRIATAAETTSIKHRRKRRWISTILAVREGALQEVRAILHRYRGPLSSRRMSADLGLIGLRQAPPQRVLFQPDLSSSRQIRHASGHLHSPQPVAATSAGSYLNNPSSNPNSMSFSIANYEPRPQMPLTLRGVITPGNNPTLFRERQRISREARAGKLGNSTPSYKGMMLPGSKFQLRQIGRFSL